MYISRKNSKMYNNEFWKPINEYPNYMVSNLGRVKSLNYRKTGKEKILTPVYIAYHDKYVKDIVKEFIKLFKNKI